MRPGRGAAQHLARKQVSRGLDRIGTASLILTCARLHPGADAVLIRLAAPVPYWPTRRGGPAPQGRRPPRKLPGGDGARSFVALIPRMAESAAHHRETVNP
jgi:hypothetical protein